jgi:primosomal protein N' (replication factor Y)
VAGADPDATPVLVTVAVPVPVRKLFTYRVAASRAAAAVPGVGVRVRFGRRHVRGTVVGRPSGPPDEDYEIRDVEAVLGEPRLGPELLELTRFVADYYLCSWGEAIEAALPPASGRPPRERVARRMPAADPEGLPARATARRRALEALPADGTPMPLSGLGAAARRALRPLVDAGWVEIVEREGGVPPATPPAGPADRPAYEPTAAQQDCLDRMGPALDRATFAPFVLFGETGSGKTEVYLRAAERTLRSGRGVLYLVPEIGLTPLLVAKISRRFPGQVAVMHSGLPARRRYAAWERVRRGECRLVVGTRSAIFAPLENLGLIVVDEEQDGSYKQEETPRYNARDLAIVRARSASAAVVLGSATPSMETFHHARSGRYTLLPLGGRVEQRPLPAVTVVDMREEFREAGAIRPVSTGLVEALQATVGRGEQALVLRNRRGWAAALHCPTCGDRVSCTRCSIALTWHRADRRLRCHYCDLEQAYPEACPTCEATEIKELGEGTERIEDELQRALPEARIERLDRDATRRKGAHERILREFDAGEIDVLVGTQMIAKGHDFPRVTLVGVLSADQSLGLPDFRAAERTFQLLTQVAGRAGRGEQPGRVVVQAFDPEHPVVGLAASQDYEAFFEREIAYRRALRYPPLSALVQLRVADADELRAAEWARSLGDELRRIGGGRLLVSGPGPAPIERIRGRYRQQILVRTTGRRRLVEAVDRTLQAVEGKVPRKAITVDVDPLSLL